MERTWTLVRLFAPGLSAYSYALPGKDRKRDVVRLRGEDDPARPLQPLLRCSRLPPTRPVAVPITDAAPIARHQDFRSPARENGRLATRRTLVRAQRAVAPRPTRHSRRRARRRHLCRARTSTQQASTEAWVKLTTSVPFVGARGGGGDHAGARSGDWRNRGAERSLTVPPEERRRDGGRFDPRSLATHRPLVVWRGPRARAPARQASVLTSARHTSASDENQAPSRPRWRVLHCARRPAVVRWPSHYGSDASESWAVRREAGAAQPGGVGVYG